MTARKKPETTETDETEAVEPDESALDAALADLEAEVDENTGEVIDTATEDEYVEGDGDNEAWAKLAAEIAAEEEAADSDVAEVTGNYVQLPAYLGLQCFYLLHGDDVRDMRAAGLHAGGDPTPGDLCTAVITKVEEPADDGGEWFVDVTVFWPRKTWFAFRVPLIDRPADLEAGNFGKAFL